MGSQGKHKRAFHYTYDALECHGDKLAGDQSRTPRSSPVGRAGSWGFQDCSAPQTLNRDVINTRRTLRGTLAGIGPLGMRRHHPADIRIRVEE
jgi:hypothetical protein